ncbi:permease prefix domain 1-containing protein [Paraclostridium sp. AKS73]|uniref:permease prefix domain 1-containing protein n=1 Tax=Paraclostridium sp. AKS73 TaxID=2876116 RepID=UPI0021DFDFEA|nr:permease prefix domain 1-containing protein [Paraclostridium sp. AKS73]MCU9814354.1 permease prefix domain 1-containing protein [Paraclostridium sp. AKS73]
MKIIDEYLKSLYKNDKSKEVKELKEELREHLITSTNEFIDNGYSEEDAQREAINQFDGGTEMLKDLHKSLKESKKDNEKLNKRMINIFKNTAILALIVCLSMMVFGGRINDNINYIRDIIDLKLDIIVSEKDLYNPKTYEKEFNDLLNTKEFNDVRYLEIYTAGNEKVLYKHTDKNIKKKSLLI